VSFGKLFSISMATRASLILRVIFFSRLISSGKMLRASCIEMVDAPCERPRVTMLALSAPKMRQ